MIHWRLTQFNQSNCRQNDREHSNVIQSWKHVWQLWCRSLNCDEFASRWLWTLIWNYIIAKKKKNVKLKFYNSIKRTFFWVNKWKGFCSGDLIAYVIIVERAKPWSDITASSVKHLCIFSTCLSLVHCWDCVVTAKAKMCHQDYVLLISVRLD